LGGKDVGVANQHLIMTKDQQVATLILNRPQKMNALTDQLIRDLKIRFEHLAMDETVRAVVIRGSGDKAFCSGYDFGALEAKQASAAEVHEEASHPLEPVAEAIDAYPYPVIAMLNGSAFGAGCELAICCDLRVAADDIRIGMPPAKIGVVYPWNGLRRFVQAVGWNHTREMFFSADTFEGPCLKAMGLVNHLVPRSELEAVTLDLAARITANAPLALRGIKKTLSHLASSTMSLAPEKVAMSQAAMRAALASTDLVEGRQALKDKRKPCFKGR
jgi:enoyl-CoA hydratase/carnithine racemase